MKNVSVIALLLLFGFSCNAPEDPIALPDLLNFPQEVPAMDVPQDNAYSPQRWKLGKRLFYDQALSIDRSTSCATCHQPELAFSDDRPLSPGAFGRPGVRNAPSLGNVGYHPYFTRDGGVPTLEMQVLVPIQEHNEFDFNIIDLAERLAVDSTYQRMSQEAYGREIDAFVITRALANFERSFVSVNSRFDRYWLWGERNALTPEEIRGMQLFYGQRAACSNCHGGFNLSNYSFENNGLYQEYADPGRKRLTENAADLARFKVPSLRNVALTGPYMHDGSIQRLDQVVEHYSTGIVQHPNTHPELHPLHLSNKEKNDLIAFLNTLTDNTFINNKSLYND